MLIILLVLSCTVSLLKAQTSFSGNGNPGVPERLSLLNNQYADSNMLDRKWSLTRYGSFYAGYNFFNGGGATVFAAPLGLQLNRRLSNNLYAFAGASIAPSYINFNPSFSPAFNKTSVGRSYTPGQFNIYSRAELGLMYVNDQKTFSISGSIGIERSSYPFYPSNRQPVPYPVW